MNLNLWLLIQAAPSEGWEIAKGVMLSLTTLGVGWTAKTVFFLRDDVRELKKVVGTDGANGHHSKLKHHDARLDAIEDRNLSIDAIAEVERQQYQGPERRTQVRRCRDTLLPPIPPVDYGEGPE